MSSDTSNVDNPAVETLYREHHRWLLTWLIQKIECPHHAADIAHDTFARLLALPQTLNLQWPKAYLAKTAGRLIIDQSRRARVERAYLTELILAADMAEHAPSPERVLSAVQKIGAVLDGLAEKPQRAFLLHYLEGQTHAVIAGQLGVSDRMVRKYLVQALVHCHQACLD